MNHFKIRIAIYAALIFGNTLHEAKGNIYQFIQYSMCCTLHKPANC